MITRDITMFSWRSLSGYRTRTLLMMLAMSIGVAAVIVLTSLGEGARRYVRNQFESIGTNLLIVLPGRAETSGGVGGMISGRIARDLTIDDALALHRVQNVTRVVPLNLAAGEISWRGKRRDAPVVGSTSDLLDFWDLSLARGKFLPLQDARRASPVCVIGDEVARELFGTNPAVGEWVRIGDRRFRVVGVLAPKGVLLGLSIDELVIIPVASAQVLFNLPSLLRIGVETRSREDVERAEKGIQRLLAERHGEEDVSVITEDAVASTFDKILVVLTLAVAGIASISLGVAGILIMNVMLIAVSQRTNEIGLLKALGASPRQIRNLFFAEAAMLSLVGGLLGVAVGQLGCVIIRQVYPALPAVAPMWATGAALATAVVTGIIFSVFPARRAAALDPALALARR